MNLHNSESMLEIYDLLYSIGATANHTGFFYTAYAVYLVRQNPERLLLVTRWLYPDVAKHYKTNWKAVERNIRIVIQQVWENNSDVLSKTVGYPIAKRPQPAKFIGLLAKISSTPLIVSEEMMNPR